MPARTWTILSFIFALPCCTFQIDAAMVNNPGEGNDITKALRAAISSTPAGGTVLLPPGNFRFDGEISVSKAVHIKGCGKNKTKLYKTRDDSGTMMRFSGGRDPKKPIIVSGIWFQGIEPSRIRGDGKSQTGDQCLGFSRTYFIVTGCRLQYFGYTAIDVTHLDERGMGLIYNNEFLDNCKLKPSEERGWTCGYGVDVGGADRTWVKDVSPGGPDYVFIEDNYFEGQRHSVCGAGGGLYVFRYNLLVRNMVGQAIDAHGGGNYGNTISTRFYEVYNNLIENDHDTHGNPITSASRRSRLINDQALRFRGGEGVIFNNSVYGYFRNLIRLSVEIRGSYPVRHQIGYASALVHGNNHRGSDPQAEGEGDLFIWGNTSQLKGGSRKVWVDKPRLLVEGRDFHVGVPRPDYTPYTYPHPSRIPTSPSYHLTANKDGDDDMDDLSNLKEFLNDTDPSKPDTDGDGALDGAEVLAGTDPLNPADAGKTKGSTESVWDLIASKQKLVAQKKEKPKEKPGLDEARELASQGDYEAAAQRLEQKIPPAAGTDDELKNLIAGFRAAKEMRSWIIDGAARGRKESAVINLLGMRMRGRVIAADEDGLVVRVMGSASMVAVFRTEDNDVIGRSVDWNELSPASFLSVAKKYAREGDETPQERLDTLDLFAQACGLKSAP